MESFSYVAGPLPAANLSCATVAKDKKEMEDRKDLHGFYSQKLAPTPSFPVGAIFLTEEHGYVKIVSRKPDEVFVCSLR